MQLLTTTFPFTIIHEDRTSENRQSNFGNVNFSIRVPQEALSEGKFVKQTRDILSGADVRAWRVGIGDFTDFSRDITLDGET